MKGIVEITARNVLKVNAVAAVEIPVTDIKAFVATLGFDPWVANSTVATILEDGEDRLTKVIQSGKNNVPNTEILYVIRAAREA